MSTEWRPARIATLMAKLERHRDNIARLEECKVKYGLDVPLALENELADERRMAMEVDAQLQHLMTGGEDPLDCLFREATSARIKGQVDQALQLYEQIQREAPTYPGIAVHVRSTKQGLERGYIDNGGGVIPDRVLLNLGGAYLRSADLRGADLRGAKLSEANLGGADLRGAYLWSADLRGAKLSEANLRGADLRGADLRGADLRGAYLSRADLWGANLRSADLTGASLSRADLSRADLGEANLRRADLSEADLSEADLSEADLSGANLSETNLRGAELTKAKLDGAALENTRHDNHTCWPEGFTPPPDTVSVD